MTTTKEYNPAFDYPIDTQEFHKTINTIFDKRMEAEGSIFLVQAPTGLGKTTGCAEAVKARMLEDDNFTVAFVCADTDAIQETLLDLRSMLPENMQERVKAWSRVHEANPRERRRADINRAYRHDHPQEKYRIREEHLATKSEAAKAQVLVMSHAAYLGKDGKQSIDTRDRSVIVIDEMIHAACDIVTFDHVDIAVLAKRYPRNDERKELLERILKWWTKQPSKNNRLEAFKKTPEWAAEVVEMSMAPVHSDGVNLTEEFQKLAYAVANGTAIVQNRHGNTVITGYVYALPQRMHKDGKLRTDPIIMLSATAHLEAGVFHPSADLLDDIEIPQIDYSGVTFHWHELPKDLPLMQRDWQMENATKIRRMVKVALDWEAMLPEDAEKTLIVCPIKTKAGLHDWFRKEDKSAKLLHWGTGVGSNEYRHCDTVVVVGEQHIPISVLLARKCSFQQKKPVTRELTPYKKPDSDDSLLIKGDWLRRCSIQMINRGTCRQITDGKAQEMTVHAFMDFGRFLKLVSEGYPGAKVVYHPCRTLEEMMDDKGWVTRPMSEKVALILMHLREDGITQVSADQLSFEYGVDVKKRSDRVRKGLWRINAVGWRWDVLPRVQNLFSWMGDGDTFKEA